MRIIAIGSRPFVAGFQLAGVEGFEVTSSKETLNRIKNIIEEEDLGLIIISDDLEKEIREEIADLKLKHPIPLIYSVPAPGSKQEKIEYRELIKRMLKIS
jgi:V/A-type H+-transporting ATPase subunit F